MLDEPQALRPIILAREAPFPLGAVEVFPATRQIVSAGRSETLEPRIMQVLVALAQAKGAILTRDDLIARCWEGRVVGDNAIHRAVSKVRDLGLSFGGGVAFQLETITKVGYRMVVGETVGAAGPQAGPAGSEPDRKGRRWVLAGLAGAFSVSGGLAVWAMRRDPAGPQVAALLAQGDQAMRTGMPDSELQGVGFLEDAVRLQPGNAAAWGKLALARRTVSEYAPPDRAAAAVTATEEAVRRALALDKRQSDALSALALLPPYFGDWYAAEQRMKSVLAIDPRHLPTLDALSYMHVGVGRAREGAVERVAYAARDPLAANQQFKLVYAYWILGRIGDADRAADRAMRLWPKHPGVWISRLWTLAFSGRAGLALAHLDDATARPDFPPAMFDSLRVSMIALDSRRPADIARAVQAVLGRISSAPSYSVNAIMILAGLGEIDRAFEVADAYLLERGPLMASVHWRQGQVSMNGEHHRKTNMLFVPACAPMRIDARFLRLAEAMGLADYWRHVGVTPDFLR